MAGQFSSSLSLDELPEHVSETPTADPRTARPPADRLSISDTRTGKPALEAKPWAPFLRRWSELRPQVGILLHLACNAFVGAMIIVIFFGVAFSMLGEPPSKAAPAAPPRADPPAVAATAPKTPPAMTAIAAPSPQPTELPAIGTQSGQRSDTAAIAETAGATPELSTGQNSQYSAIKQSENASAEIVHGPVTNAVDAMTWLVGDQTVNLWGIRPGPANLSSSLIGFVDQVRAKGAVECRRQPHSSRYRCLMATGEDVGEAALLAGFGRAADGSSVAYRTAEAQAHQKSRGLWAKP